MRLVGASAAKQVAPPDATLQSNLRSCLSLYLPPSFIPFLSLSLSRLLLQLSKEAAFPQSKVSYYCLHLVLFGPCPYLLSMHPSCAWHEFPVLWRVSRPAYSVSYVCVGMSTEYSAATYQMVSVDPFVTFYNFCFELLKPEGKKYVEKEMACVALTAIWKQVPLKQSPHIDTFVEFLNSQEKILSVNSDQWKSFVQFSKQVDGKLTGFSEDDPWPSLYDDYVAWFRQQLGTLGTTAP